MGLHKQIMSDDGVPIYYHRISSLNIITNHENLVEVKSYVDDKYRQEELTGLEDGTFVPGSIYICTRWYSHEYNPESTVADMYEWLKTADYILNAENPFKGAEDAMDDWDIPNEEESIEEGI